MLDPVVRTGSIVIERELDDGKEEAPDEDVLFATGDFDGLLAVGFVLVLARTLPRVRTADLVAGRAVLLHPELSGEDHLPGGGVNPELEVGVAVEQGADAIVHLHRLEAREEARIRVERQLPLAVIREIVVPHEQVLGEGVEVECVALFGLAIGVDDFAEALEGRGQPCLARSVVGVKQDELLVLQLLPQVCGEGVEVRERRCVSHDSLPVQRGKELLQQTLLVLLERVELAGLCVELIVDGGQAVGDLLLLGQSSSVWR